ncbi:MAG: DegV family protein [Anaerolineae bacterium]
MAVRIVTDSGCDLPPELDSELRAWGVHTIPFVFNFGLEACEDKSMSMQAFLARALQTWPTTAAPSVGAYASAFQHILAAGDQALCLTITGRHSGTYNAARLAAEDFPPDQVAVVDTLSLSLGEGFLALAAVQAAQAGATLHEVVAILRDMIGRIHFFIGLDTLDYVVRGGRASRFVGAIASLLQLRPILSVEEGELTLRDKPRTRARCKQRLLAMAGECLPAVALGVMHAAAPDEAHELAESLASLSGAALSTIPVVEVGMALATHAGPGGLGIVAVSEPRAEGGPEGRFTILGHELPRINLPHIDLPHIDLPRIGRDE